VIVVDTSVWIDFFAGRSTQSHIMHLKHLLQNSEELAICGVILTEVLQGIRNDEQFLKTELYFQALTLLPMAHKTFIFSAEIYRTLRKQGLTIRKPIDCMIAAVTLENHATLLHNDRDFDAIARFYPLNMTRKLC